MLKKFNENVLKGIVKVRTELFCCVNNKKGQGLTEYGLILAIVAIGVIAVLGLLSGKLEAVFQKIVDTITLS